MGRWSIRKNWSLQGFARSVAKNMGCMMLIGYLFYGFWWCGLPGIVFLYPLCRRDYRAWQQKRELRLSLEFREALQSMRTAMHAGYAAENAVREAIRDLRAVYGEQSEIVREFRQMWNELQMQVPVEQVFRNFAERSRVEEIRQFAVIFQTAKRSGGDLIAIMDRTEAAISEKLEVRQEIATLLAAKKLEWNVMVVIPLCIILYMKAAFPEFMAGMYRNVQGALIMTGCLLGFLGAYLLGERILRNVPA